MTRRLRVQVVERALVASASLAAGLAPHFEVVSHGAAVAVVDLNTAAQPVEPLVRSLCQSGARVLALASSPDAALIGAAIRAGADGFLAGVRDYDELALALENLAAGREVFGPEVTLAFADPQADALEIIDATDWEIEPVRARQHADAPISAREEQILRMVATGHSSQSIARVLRISVPTVRKHRENLMRKLGLHNIAQVTAFALRRNLLATPGAPGVT